MADVGSDVADYRAIDEQFGTTADWEALRDGLHDRGMRLVVDLVLNHTSDEHEWFSGTTARTRGSQTPTPTPGSR
jgi:oligo-1,6-glucosidase